MNLLSKIILGIFFILSPLVSIANQESFLENALSISTKAEDTQPIETEEGSVTPVSEELEQKVTEAEQEVSESLNLLEGTALDATSTATEESEPEWEKVQVAQSTLGEKANEALASVASPLDEPVETGGIFKVEAPEVVEGNITELEQKASDPLSLLKGTGVDTTSTVTEQKEPEWKELPFVPLATEEKVGEALDSAAKELKEPVETGESLKVKVSERVEQKVTETQQKVSVPSATEEKLGKTLDSAAKRPQHLQPIKVEFFQESDTPSTPVVSKTESTRLEPKRPEEALTAESKTEVKKDAPSSFGSKLEPILVSPSIQDFSSEDVLPRYVEGTLKKTKRVLFLKRSYPYKIVDSSGSRLAFVDAAATVLNRPLESYIDKQVVIYGELEKLEKSNAFVIRTEAVSLK